ncbi:MAG: histidine kinase [Firmicutes bacterium]|nr:histidine kinase [Bacillota bacterium]
MGSSILTQEIIYNISDITAGVFLIVLTLSIALQNAKHPGMSHLFSATTLMLAGVFLRIFARVIEQMPTDYAYEKGTVLLSPATAPAIWAVAFMFVAIAITESANHVIYINEGKDRRGLGSRYIATLAMILAGCVIYAFIRDIDVFTNFILLQFVTLWVYLRKRWSVRAAVEFWRASIAAVITAAIALVFDPVRLTGLGFSMMLLIIAQQYHEHLREELIENEAELARSKVRLLAEQISPHYIYNSLQSISGLCTTDPAKAQKAIEVFSGYLRGNLESLTQEELIPFTRELEHTQAYLELEQLSGLRRFVAEYDLKVTDFMLPPLVLQPVVENAVKHGAYAVAASGAHGEESATRITISTFESDGAINIVVTDSIYNRRESTAISADPGDNAPNTAKNRYKTKSIGLENVRTRLAIQCGGALDISNSDRETTVRLKLPKN